jgi:hypothetical protein
MFQVFIHKLTWSACLRSSIINLNTEYSLFSCSFSLVVSHKNTESAEKYFDMPYFIEFYLLIIFATAHFYFDQ